MASDRNASRASDAQGRASAEALHVDEAQPAKDKGGSDSTPPRAGRTGHLGAKAERPAENRARKTSEGDAEPTRGGKPPSPAASERGEGGLSQPVRDATG